MLSVVQSQLGGNCPKEDLLLELRANVCRFQTFAFSIVKG